MTLEDWIKELTKSKKRNNPNYNDVQRISGELLEAPNLDEVDNKKILSLIKKLLFLVNIPNGQTEKTLYYY